MSERAPVAEPPARVPAPQSQPARMRQRPSSVPSPAAARFDDTIARTATVIDDDLARARITRQLLTQLGTALGFDASRITIRVDSGAEARLSARGAHGLQEGSTVLLHPDRYDPATPSGRFLLAHETAHAAQRHAAVPGSVRSAEREADAVGLAFATYQPTLRPTIALPAHVPAAFDGPDFDPAALRELVLENHAGEIDLMRTALSYGVVDWAVTDDDISDVLRILETYPYHTQTIMVAALGEPYGSRLADNISAVHFSRYRTSILAAYDALSGAQPDALQANPFEGMDWRGLTAQEHAALKRIIPNFRRIGKGQAWYRGLKAEELAHIQDILSREPAAPELDEQKRAFEAETKRRAARAEAKEVLVNDLTAASRFVEKARQRLSYSATDWAVTDSEALSLLDDVAMFVNRPGELRAIVDALDSNGLLDRWIDNIPASTLYTDMSRSIEGQPVNRRSVYLRVLIQRPAWKNSKQAEELLSRGLFDWTVSDDEAIMAAQLVKALPDHVRVGFHAYDGGRFATELEGERSLSVRKGIASNPYTGGADGGDLRAIKAQLLDDALWHLGSKPDEYQARITRLRQLIMMARAADEARWVFDQSRDRYENDAVLHGQYDDWNFFQRIIDPFRLFVPKGFRTPDGAAYPARESYQPEQLEGNTFGTDNFFYRKIIRGLVLMGGSLFRKGSRLQVFGESIGGEGMNFADIAQITGGSLMGAEFVDIDKTKGGQRAALLDNSVRWDLDHGVIEMRASELDISAINYPMPDKKVQTGGVRVSGLHLHMEYPDKQSAAKLTMLRLRVDNLDIDDFMMIKSASMLGIERISVRQLHVDLVPAGEQNPMAAPDESIAVGSIFLTPLFNVMKIGGTIDALVKGLLEPTTPLNLTASVASIAIHGITTSGGQYIDHVDVNELNIRTRTSQGKEQYRAWLATESGRLATQAERLRAQQKGIPDPKPAHWVEFDTEASVLRQKSSIDKELETLANAERDLTALDAKEKTEKLSEAERARQTRLRTYLAGVEGGGFAVDVGHVSARGIAGKLTMGDVSLDDVRAYGHSAGAVLGALTDSTTMNRMLRGPGYRGTLAGVEAEGDPMAFASLGRVELDAVNIQGSIPTQAEADKDLKAAIETWNRTPYDPRLKDEVDRLRQRAAMTADYWRIITAGEISAADRATFNTARNWLLADRKFHVGHFLAKDTTLELTQGGQGATSIGLEARELEARDIDAGALHLDSLSGTNVRLGVEANLASLMTVGGGKKSAAGYLGADHLRLAGLSHKATGAEVKEIVIDALKAKVDVRNGQTTASIAATKIQAMGVNWALSAQVLEYHRGKLMQIVPDKRTPAEVRQLADIENLLDMLKTTTDQLKEVEAKLGAKGVSKDEKASLVEQKNDLQDMLRAWQTKVELRRLTIADLNIDITGLGDVLGDNYKFDDALKGGITVTGAGKDRQITSGVTAEGAWTKLDSGRTRDMPGGGSKVVASSRAGVELLTTGPIRGGLTYATDHISLNGFEIETLAATDLRYSGGGIVVWGRGTTRLQKIAITGRIDTPLADRKDSGAPADERRMSKIAITSFSIKEVVADDIQYRDVNSGFQLTLKSGTLKDIYANDVVVDFGKSDAEPMLIRGGKAGFAAAQGLHANATTAGGLALANVLNTGTLAARFADDGHITADLGDIASSTHLTQPELDAQINTRSLTLHVELLPGAKGYGDATQKFRLSGETVEFDVAKGPAPGKGEADKRTRAGGSITKLDTGEITRTPSGRIDAPAIKLPTVTLDHLYLNLPTAVIDIAKGNPVQLIGTEASVTALPNPRPESQRKADEFAFDSIILRSFKIPTIAVRGMKATIPTEDGEIVVTLPSSRVGMLKDLTLTDRSGGTDGFVIKPNENWSMLGKLNITDTNLLGVGVDLGDAVIKSLDAKVSNFNIEFIGADDTVVAFDSLTATNIEGSLLDDYAPGDPDAPASGKMPGNSAVQRLKSAGFSVSMRDPGTEHSITARGFRMDKTGISVKGIDIAGLVYSDATRGINLNIVKATIAPGADGKPAFSRTPDGKIVIPDVTVNDARFRIDDVLKLGGPDKKEDTPAKDALTYGPDMKLLNQLSGTVQFTVEPYLYGTAAGMGAYAAGPFNIVVRILNGKVNFKQVEDESTGYLADAAVSLDYVRGGTVDYDHDPLRIRPPQLQLNIIGVDPIWWDLTPSEGKVAETNWVDLGVFIRQSPGMKKSDEPSETAVVKDLFFGNVNTHLELAGNSEIRLGNAGSIKLGGGGPNDAGFAIDITSSAVPAISATVSSLHANVSSIDLKLPGGSLKTGGITIKGANVATLSFEKRDIGPVYTDSDGNQTRNRLPIPTSLEGGLKDAKLKDLEYTPIWKPSKKWTTPAAKP